MVVFRLPGKCTCALNMCTHTQRTHKQIVMCALMLCREDGKNVHACTQRALARAAHARDVFPRFFVSNGSSQTEPGQPATQSANQQPASRRYKTAARTCSCTRSLANNAHRTIRGCSLACNATTALLARFVASPCRLEFRWDAAVRAMLLFGMQRNPTENFKCVILKQRRLYYAIPTTLVLRRHTD